MFMSKQEDSNTIRILLAGDYAPGGLVANIPGYSPFNPIESVILDHDVCWLNLECGFPFGNKAITNRSAKVPGDWDLFLRLHRLYENRFIYTMGNNHTTDYGRDSIRTLQKHIKRLQLPIRGVGNTPQEIHDYHVWHKDGLSVAMLSFTWDRKCVGDHLQEESGTMLPILNEDSYKQVQQAAASHTHVIVSIHWGKEYVKYPLPEMRAQAQRMVQAGATLVFGHHPHVLQGMETIEGVPVYYSLGNFFFPAYDSPNRLRWTKNSRLGMVLSCTLNADGLEEVIPVPVYQPGNIEPIQTMQGDKLKEFHGILNKLSHPLAQLSAIRYELFFEKQLRHLLYGKLLKSAVKTILRPSKRRAVLTGYIVQQIRTGRNWFLN